MVYRLLLPEEYPKLLEAGLPANRLPHPDNSRIIIAEDEGVVKGYFVAQLQISAEPIWVDPDSRGGLVVFNLLKELEKEIALMGLKTYITHSSGPQISDYLKRLGFVSTGWEMFTKEIK